MTVYADTSFLVSLYIADLHSPEAERKMAPGTSLLLTALHVAEWTHAVEQHLFRKVISRDDAGRLYEDFHHDVDTGVWVEAALPDSAFDLCARLGRRYAARYGLRTLDTLHVAAALGLKAECFWTFDERQKKLARAMRLKTT